MEERTNPNSKLKAQQIAIHQKVKKKKRRNESPYLKYKKGGRRRIAGPVPPLTLRTLFCPCIHLYLHKVKYLLLIKRRRRRKKKRFLCIWEKDLVESIWCDGVSNSSCGGCMTWDWMIGLCPAGFLLLPALLRLLN